jgi:hypothetical protein
MISRFFIALTTDCQDGQFLVVAHGLDDDETHFILLPEIDHQFVEWGHTVQIDMGDEEQTIDGFEFSKAQIIRVEPNRLTRAQAEQLHAKAALAMVEMGMTETRSDLSPDDVLATRDDYFGRFPDVVVGDELDCFLN